MSDMSKKEYCKNNPVVAYYSGLGGFEIHGIEHGIEDFIYAVSGAWNGIKKYHKLKIRYEKDIPYVRLYGYNIPMNECIRTNI